MHERSYYVYILTNYSNKVLYIGMTNDIIRRIYEHKQKIHRGFTSQYNLNKLVYILEFATAMEAITAEKKLKGWTRRKKTLLIMVNNPGFKDLSLEF